MDNGLHKFKKTKKLDRRKLQKRKSNGVLLIYWQYDEPINPKAFAKKLRRGKRRVYGVLKYNKSYIIFAHAQAITDIISYVSTDSYSTNVPLAIQFILA